MTKKVKRRQFAICISNEGCDDLEVWKLYQVLPDEVAARDRFLRVVDESGEDYLYPAKRFVVVELPPPVVKRLLTLPASARA
jgi:hypothetical protein